jgi:hypothetical protein
VAVAPNATDDILLKLLEDKDERVRKSVRRVKSPSKLVLEGMFWADVGMYKKQLTQLVRQAPEYAWVAPDAKNIIHQDVSVRQYGDTTSQDKIATVKHSFLTRKDQNMRSLNRELEALSVQAASEPDRLEKEYEQHPERWNKIIRSPHCRKQLLSKIFIAHGDVSDNPLVQAKLRSDCTWLRSLLPRRRQERLKLADDSPFSDILLGLYLQEENKRSREKADIELLKRVALNVHTKPDTLELIYEDFGVREVLKNPNCPKKLRKMVFRSDYKEDS